MSQIKSYFYVDLSTEMDHSMVSFTYTTDINKYMMIQIWLQIGKLMEKKKK